MRAPTKTRDRARELRKDLSLPEKLLWVRLRRREPGLPTFRRQHPFGPYVLDFYCSHARLCIEVDGESHSMGDHPARDGRRDAYLRANGIEVVRLTASYVLDDPEQATDWVRQLAFERLGARTAYLLGE
jgi:very-short-patch-repair endonuclease